MKNQLLIIIIDRLIFLGAAVLKQTEKELQKCQQEIDEYKIKVEETYNLLKKKNEDEKSMTTTLKVLQKKLEKLQKQNNEVSKKNYFSPLVICSYSSSDDYTETQWKNNRISFNRMPRRIVENFNLN